MKKVLTLTMVLVMILAMSVPAMAATLSGTATSGTVEVTYGVSEGYQVTIPEAFDLVADTDVEKTVSAANVLIPSGETLTVTMNSANNLSVVYDESSIEYTVKVGGAAFTNGGTVLSVESGTTSGNATLKFNTTAAQIAAATQAGEHADTLTFACSVA